MHEYALMESLLGQLSREMDVRKVQAVRGLRLRLGSTVAEGSIRQAFDMLSPGTPFQGSELTIEPFDITHTCPRCAHVEVVRHDDLIGHVFICPRCRTAVEIEEAHDVRVADITVD